MQLQTTMAIIGVYKCTVHGHENHRNYSCPTLSRLSLAFPCIPDVSVGLCNWLFFEFWKQTHTHTQTHTRTHTFAHARALETICSIIFQLNEIFKMCTWFSKMYVVPCISNHYIRIKIQDIFWNAWPQRAILFQQGCSY